MGEQQARTIIDAQVDAINEGWRAVCDDAGMTDVERATFAGRQFFNPYAFEGYGPAPRLR